LLGSFESAFGRARGCSMGAGATGFIAGFVSFCFCSGTAVGVVMAVEVATGGTCTWSIGAAVAEGAALIAGTDSDFDGLWSTPFAQLAIPRTATITAENARFMRESVALKGCKER
jgi:hypothetical protein